MAFLRKSRQDILNQALRKVEKNTSLSATGPGSIVRAMTEAVTTEIADLYDAIDFNMSLQTISTAQGRALDLMGSLYNVQRKTITQIAAIDKALGSFYFYVDSPTATAIVIPAGTRVYTDSDSYIGETFSYRVTESITIPVGRLRAWATIEPLYSDSVFTAGIDTLTVHDFEGAPSGTTLRCTNSKPISPQVGYEDDDSYRVRIIKAVRTSAGGTLEAIRFASLSVAGVRDAIVRNTAYGLGSFEVLVALEQGTTSEVVLRGVSAVVDSVRPMGSRVFIQQPKLLNIDIKFSLVLKNDTLADGEVISKRAHVAVLRYLNTLSIGTPLVFSSLLQYILSSSDYILDVSILEFKANGENILQRNYTPRPNEQLIPGSIVVTYSV